VRNDAAFDGVNQPFFAVLEEVADGPNILGAKIGFCGDVFSGFFFALTESEIAAAELLGHRHRVALFNNLTGELLISSVPDIIARTRSMTWQLSVQL
jgi:hypothetical protein